MTFTFGKACILLLGCDILVAVLGQDDEWIDPTDMFQYDETSKTMKQKLRDQKRPPVATNRDHNKEASHCDVELSQCLKTLYFLRKEIQNVKLKAHNFMEQEGLNLDPGSKLAQLINSIQHLTENEDFHTIPNQCLTYCIKIRTSTMMLSDRFVPELLKTMTFSSEGKTHYLLLAVTLLPLFLYKLAKCFRGNEEQRQPGEIEHPEVNEPLVYQNNGRPGEEERDHSLEHPPNMPAEVLGSEGADDANSDDPGQQSWMEDCYDENYDLIKPPTPETQPAITGH